MAMFREKCIKDYVKASMRLNLSNAPRLAATLLLWSLIIAGNAKDYTLRITMTNGEVHSFAFTEKPEVVFTGSTMNVASSKTLSTYLISDVAQWTFDDAAGISSAKIEDAKFTIGDNAIEFVNLKANDVVTICTVDGKVIRNIHTADGTATVPFSKVGRGLVIIKINEKSNKIILR